MKKNESFEDAMNRLEEIAAELEDPSVNLDRALALYQEAAQLVRYCSEKLDTIKLEMEKVNETFEKKDLK